MAATSIFNFWKMEKDFLQKILSTKEGIEMCREEESDDDDDTPRSVLLMSDAERRSLAEKYKNEGNTLIARKAYADALDIYDLGIQTVCSDFNLMAILYNNRATAKFYLSAYRSALNDAERALTLKDDYHKARLRAAKCAIKLSLISKSQQFYNEIIGQIKDDADAKDLAIRNEAEKLHVDIEKGFKTFQRLCAALRDRDVKFEDVMRGESLSDKHLRPNARDLEDYPIRFDEDNPDLVVYPALFMFPDEDAGFSVEHLPENEFLSNVWSDLPLPFNFPNKSKFLKLSCLDIYAQNKKMNRFCKINKKSSIRNIVRDRNVFISEGMLMFLVVIRGKSAFEKLVSA